MIFGQNLIPAKKDAIEKTTNNTAKLSNIYIVRNRVTVCLPESGGQKDAHISDVHSDV